MAEVPQMFDPARSSCTIPRFGFPRIGGVENNNEVLATMVKIRLSRTGAKKRPFYHIVVMDERRKRDGRSIERLGFFNPVAQGKDARLQVDTDRVDHWLSVGAHMSERVRDLVKEARKQAAEAPQAEA